MARGMERRTFLSRTAAAMGGMALWPGLDFSKLGGLADRLPPMGDVPAERWAEDEAFWREVRLAYRVSPSMINLNNGGVSPAPGVVQEAVERYMRLSNESPSYYMWRVLDQGREPLRERLARLAGVGAEELAINRNTTEALETVIFGLRLERGDEVVLSKQDYPNMINAWRQRELRDGIVLRWVDHRLPASDAGPLTEGYVSLFTERTRVVHLTQVINWTGQVLPCRDIAREAHRRGIEVVVDGAHAFAHLDVRIPDTGADYYGASLHKWLCAPIGTGLLYVKKSKIPQLFPLFASPEPEADDIRKFEALGTRSFPLEQAIGQAIDFHEWIGAERKFARLHFLKSYWLERAVDLGYKSYTSPLPEWSGALAAVQWRDEPPGQLASYLQSEHKIHAVAIDWEDIHAVRITPNVHTMRYELDKLLRALKSYAS